MATIFITGISTGVGKTVASALVTESLEADYWKPVQAGDLHAADTHTVRDLISNPKTVFHKNAYALQTPASPHLAAAMDGISIDVRQIKAPETTNQHLVIEGAGGLLVPLNGQDTIADLIRPDYKTIIVSRHYLGSINHTLLTAEALQHRKLPIAGIIFSGDENPSSEKIILEKTGLKMIGRIDEEPYFDKSVILEYAGAFRQNLLEIL